MVFCHSHLNGQRPASLPFFFDFLETVKFYLVGFTFWYKKVKTHISESKITLQVKELSS